MSSRISGIGVIGIEKKIKELHTKNLMKKMYLLYLLEVFIGIEKVEKIINIKVN